MAAISPDAPESLRLAQLLEESKRDLAPYVQSIDIADQSFSAAFRGLTHEELIEEAMRSAWEGSLSAIQAVTSLKQTSDGVSNQGFDPVGRLEQLTKSLRGSVDTDTGSGHELSERELIQLLKKASLKERLDFVMYLVEWAGRDETAKSYLSGRLNNIFITCAAEEKVELLTVFAGLPEGEVVCELISNLLKSAQNRDELNLLVRCIGTERLVGSGNPELSELAATAILLSELDKIYLAFNGQISGTSEGDKRSEYTNKMLAEMHLCLATNTELRSTKRFAICLQIIEQGEEWLKESLEQRLIDPRDQAINWETFIAKMQLQLTYGLLLRDQPEGIQEGIGIDNSPLPSHGVKWTLAQIKAAESGLSKIPGVLLLTTPWLYEIQRVETLGSPYILGRRFEDGVIRIANSAVNQRGLELLYPGCSSLEVVLVHELGHSIQLGSNKGSFELSPPDDLVFSSGDPRYEFKTYMGLAGWRVLAPWQYEPTNQGLSVRIGDEEYPIGTAVKFNGQEVVMTLKGGLLYIHRALGPFSLGDYARTNPWEDFAEAFCEYILIPERLVQFAPEKFVFLEQEFGHYRANQLINSKLSDRISRVN
jgi:hypothetical protein